MNETGDISKTVDVSVSTKKKTLLQQRKLRNGLQGKKKVNDEVDIKPADYRYCCRGKDDGKLIRNLNQRRKKKGKKRYMYENKNQVRCFEAHGGGQR